MCPLSSIFINSLVHSEPLFPNGHHEVAGAYLFPRLRLAPAMKWVFRMCPIQFLTAKAPFDRSRHAENITRRSRRVLTQYVQQSLCRKRATLANA